MFYFIRYFYSFLFYLQFASIIKGDLQISGYS